MFRVKSKYTDKVVYFRFFASAKYPNCFWHSETIEATGFNLAKKNDFIPLDAVCWKEIEEERP